MSLFPGEVIPQPPMTLKRLVELLTAPAPKYADIPMGQGDAETLRRLLEPAYRAKP